MEGTGEKSLCFYSTGKIKPVILILFTWGPLNWMQWWGDLPRWCPRVECVSVVERSYLRQQHGWGTFQGRIECL